MSGTETFTYEFTDAGGVVDITATVDATPTDSTGLGEAYVVTAISGSVDGVAINGESGAQGTIATSSGGAVYTFNYDNAIFLASTDGANGNINGIDNDGLLFSINGVDYNLFSQGGQTVLYDGNGLAETVTLVSTDAPCFCAGTLILTDRGQVPVEQLAIGDQVIDISGAAKPIRWIGTREIQIRFSIPMRVLPIRIKAHALADNVPSRDLLVSPDHAFLIDGILVQAGALVNDLSIVRQTRVPAAFTYYHIEVADHALILAENAPAETFVNNVDRMGFDNWAEHEALYGDESSIPEMEYPRAKAARQLPPATLVQLKARSEALYGATLAVA